MHGKVAPEESYLCRQHIVLFTLGAVALFRATIALEMSLLHLFCAVSSLTLKKKMKGKVSVFCLFI
jgi:hypothetical protein